MSPGRSPGRGSAGIAHSHSCRLPFVAARARPRSVLRRCGIGSRLRFQIGTFPRNDNMRTAFGKIIEGEVGPAALEEALGDKDPEPHVVLRAAPGRQVGFAEPAEQMSRITGAV